MGRKKGLSPVPPQSSLETSKEEFLITNLSLVRSLSSEIHVHWSKRLKRMKLEADSLLSLEKDSHCVRREESPKSKTVG